MSTIGLDTNVALRWLAKSSDDDLQAAASSRAVAAADMVYVNVIVLAELMWVSGQKGRLGRAEQASVIKALLGNPGVMINEADAVTEALTAFEAGGAGFVDHLIGVLNARAGCATTLTFDKTAAKTAHFTLLT